MALSRQVIISDGVTKQYPISFSDGYLSRDEVSVYEEFNDGTPSDPIAFTWINNALIELARVPVIGSKIIIERNVDAAYRKVNFIPEYIKSSDLNTMYKHLLYLCQAVVDGRFEAALVKDLNMGFNRIYNLGAPVQDNDAVRLVDIKDYTDLAKDILAQVNNSRDAAKVSEDNAKKSEINAKASEDIVVAKVDGFDQHVEDAKISIDQFTGMKIDDIDSHAAIKEQEFDTNAAEKQQQVDTSANNANVSELKAKASELNSKESERRAKIWAEGTDSEVASIGGTLSSEGWAKRAEEIVGKGVINDNLISTSTTYSSDKLEKHFAVNEDHDSVLDCLDVLDTNIGAKTTVPLSALLAIDSDARPSHKAKGAEVYDEFGTMGIIDSVTPTEAVIITKESREKVRIVDTLDIQKNGFDQYFVDLNSNQIRNEIIKGKIVQLRFDDVITNTGEQLYPFETFDKDGYAVFRRNVISTDKAERINIKVDYQGIVTFDTVTLQAGSGSVIGDIHYTSRTTVPEGGVWCDGSEITEAQNPKFYKMLVDGEIQSVTYAEYANQISANGYCELCALDTVAKAFKVPTKPNIVINKDGTVRIKGNGKTVGVTDGNQTAGLILQGGGDKTIMLGGFADYDTPLGKPTASAVSTLMKNQRVGITTDASKSGMVADTSVSEYRAYIVVSNKSDTTIDIKHEVQLNNPFFFGMYHFFESDPNNASWLISNGNFHSGDTYKGFYQWLVSAQATPIEGVSVKLSTEAYTDFDYVINNGNSTFRLPLKVKGASGSAVKGNGLTLGMTDGTRNGGLVQGASQGQLLGRTGLYGVNTGVRPSSFGDNMINEVGIGITTDPTKSGIVTADDGLKLYFYVGETVQDANMILAGRALSQLANKADVGSFLPDYTAGISLVEGREYVADIDCYVLFAVSSVNLNADTGFYINGEEVVKLGNSYAGSSDWTGFFIPKGTPFKAVRGTGSLFKYVQYPLKGAN